MFSSRNGFNKLTLLHQEIFKKVALSSHVGGSKRQPYTGLVKVVTTNNRQYKNWSEVGIFGLTNVLPLSYRGLTKNPQLSPFFIGEHAISRVFQRSQMFKDLDKIDPNTILAEMRLIPFWASFWISLLDELSRVSDVKKSLICPLIPSPHGLFFCKLTDLEQGIRFVEVRTFVHESSLTDSQKQVRTMLLNTSKNIEHSILTLFPYYDDTPNLISTRYELVIVLSLILGRMRSDTYKLCEMVISENNVCDVYELDQNIKHLIVTKSFSESRSNNCDEILNAYGYSYWISEMQKLFQFGN